MNKTMKALTMKKPVRITLRLLLAIIITLLLSVYQYYHYAGKIQMNQFFITSVISMILLFIAFTIMSRNFLDGE